MVPSASCASLRLKLERVGSQPTATQEVRGHALTTLPHPCGQAPLWIGPSDSLGYLVRPHQYFSTSVAKIPDAGPYSAFTDGGWGLGICIFQSSPREPKVQLGLRITGSHTPYLSKCIQVPEKEEQSQGAFHLTPNSIFSFLCCP